MTQKDNPIHCHVEQVYPLTDSIIQLFIQPENESLTYAAGQYVDVILKNGEQAPFSIANAPLGSALLELHIRHLPETAFNNQLLFDIKNQRHITISHAKGNCTYKQLDNNKPIIFLAGGTGFSPIKAIIEQALAAGLQQAMYLYWGARKANDLYLENLAQHWDNSIEHFHYIPVLSEANDSWQGRRGLVHEAVLEDVNDLSPFQVFTAGPIEMVIKAKTTFCEIGLDKKNIYSDTFEFM